MNTRDTDDGDYQRRCYNAHFTRVILKMAVYIYSQRAVPRYATRFAMFNTQTLPERNMRMKVKCALTF